MEINIFLSIDLLLYTALVLSIQTFYDLYNIIIKAVLI
jgi:hypothetical protein